MLLENAISRYYERLGPVLRRLLPEPENGDGPAFSPGIELPELTPAVREYFAASDLAHTPLRAYRGRSLALLDLMRNPATLTTKTFASLVIVARAIRFIQDTGERVTIVTPSSANKAAALRDAVLRAIELGLVTPQQLNVVVVVPVGSTPKMRDSGLFTDPELRARNPIAVYAGDEPGTVKALAQSVVEEHGGHIRKAVGTNLWYTLRLENYLAADVVRAFAEAEFFAPADNEPRLHVHAVSSAYGLLGHAYGHSLLKQSNTQRRLPPRYFLVQHLGAPDMVLSLYHGSAAPEHAPAYVYDPDSGLYGQQRDQRFPALTFDPREILDTTFYTRKPVTSPRMNKLIREQGGGGIVVSLYECLERYPYIRAVLGEAGVELPADPRALREWSLVMAMTGILNAIDRDLVQERDVLVHGSGSYASTGYVPLSAQDMWPVEDESSLKDVVLKASGL
ncbi:DUF6002 family protein [Streptomyces sp. S07_1.15]|uniref:DUF6002 family protein n=1 Tax=Streptomyces sp. S07_1.15 TaxID=2873925 RepID=UPI001D13290A|nr:DUF6002 family protein [Streptomyces sp. S07_1.15]MCC3650548.1 DUF6002 family protein [Streptomyces sp. S07_1.15]